MLIGILIWYSIGRFLIKGLRTDSLMLTVTLRMAQVLSLTSIVASLAILIYRRFSGQQKQHYFDV